MKRVPRIWWLHLPLVLALLAGLALRLGSMQKTDFGYDEVMQARVTLVGLRGVAGVARSHFGASPLDYYLCWISYRLFGTDASLRFPALFWGLFAIILGWRVGRRFGGRREAITVAWLIACSPMLVFAGHLVRWYSALVFFSLAIPLSSSIFLKRPNKRNGVLFALAVCLGFLEHPFVVFPLFCCLGACFIGDILLAGRFSFIKKKVSRYKKIRLSRFLYLMAIAALSTLPFLAWAIYAKLGRGSPFKSPEWGWELFRRPFFHFSGGRTLYIPITLSLVLLGIVDLFRRYFSLGLYLLLLLLSWPLLILISINRSYIFYTRHIIYILPWILFAAGFGLTSVGRFLSRYVPTRLKSLVPVVLVVLYIGPLLGQVPGKDWDFGKPLPLRTIREIIESNIQPDTYFILPSVLYNPVEWYALRHEGLAGRIWQTSGPEKGPEGLSFPMRVLWISNFPPSPWIQGKGFCYKNIYVFYETYAKPQALGERLLEFGFNSFVLGSSTAKAHLQHEMQRLSKRWNVELKTWFREGYRTQEDYIESDSLTVKAQPLLQEKRYEEASRVLEEAVRRNPYNAHALGSFAFARQYSERPLEALKTWFKVLQICPNFYEAYWNLAQIHERLGQTELALKAASRAIRFPEASTGAFRFYENLLRQAGRNMEADVVRMQRKILESERIR